MIVLLLFSDSKSYFQDVVKDQLREYVQKEKTVEVVPI